MSSIQYSQLPFEDLEFNSIVPFETVSGKTGRNIAGELASLGYGSNVKIIRSQDDLPPLLNGFRILEQGKNYLFTEAASFSDPILFPAGWIGDIRKSFRTPADIVYTGTTPMFNTLNIDGAIDTIVIGLPSSIAVSTSAPHGLVDGQYVNLRTSLYNLDRIQIFNASGSVFSATTPFVGNDTGGAFNTGVTTFQFIDFAAVNAGTADFMDVTSSGTLGSIMLFHRFQEFGFLSPGIIRKSLGVLTNTTALGFITDGLTLEDCDAAELNSISFISLDPSATAANAITIKGAAPRLIGLFGCQFTMTNAAQHPVRIEGATVTTADEIIIQNSPDNNVSTDYFDTSSGGLDQINPQIITVNNGLRANSHTVGSAFVNGNTAVTTIALADTFQDLNFGTLIASVNLEGFTLTNATTGEFTYIDLKPKHSSLSMSITIRKTGGATQVYHIKFVIDKGAGFVNLDDNIILPLEVKTANDSGPYLGQVQLKLGDKVIPQISGIGTSDNIIVDSASINF